MRCRRRSSACCREAPGHTPTPQRSEVPIPDDAAMLDLFANAGSQPEVRLRRSDEFHLRRLVTAPD